MLKVRPWDLKKLHKHEIILEEGEFHNKFYIIRTGHLELTRRVWKVIHEQPLEIIQLKTEKKIVKERTHEIPELTPVELDVISREK
jgi:hypothetical protein